MKKLSKTGQEMAELGGITKQAYSAYMQGKTLPASSVLITWAEKLNLNINWLLLGKGEMFLSESAELVGLQNQVNELTAELADLQREHIELLHERDALLYPLSLRGKKKGAPSVQEDAAPYAPDPK